MGKHVIEFECECERCEGTGIYVGIGEGSGVGVVCAGCKGTGKDHVKITYKDFEGRKRRRGLQRVLKANPGIGIGRGNSTKYGRLSLEDFGGMPYEDWYAGKRFPPKSEMRKFTCPAWWYQTVDYKRRPNWKECIETGSFSSCKHFKNKEKCWERWDKKRKK